MTQLYSHHTRDYVESDEPVILSHPDADIPLANFREQVVMRVVRMLPALPFTILTNLRFQKRFSLFRKPMRYTELVNHKKLYDRNPLLTKTADKYEVRDYVASRIGGEYLIPLQQVVDRPQDIDFDKLHGRVVIKGTHGCNMTMVIDADRHVDRARVFSTTQKWLETNWYHVWKEWAYRDIKPRLVLENFIGVDGNPPPDYKFHVFNGKVEVVQVDTDRFIEHQSSLLTPDWHRLNVVGTAFDAAEKKVEPPINLEKMMHLAEQLAGEFNYCRVDLYDVNGKIYFGEITHYPGAGSVAFRPRSFDDALGELWRNGTPIPPHFIND